MQVYKFGGASVKDAEAFQNVSSIVSGQSDLLIVISAIGKTTNHLEAIVDDFYYDRDFTYGFQKVLRFHEDICGQLFPSKDSPVWETLKRIFNYLELFLNSSPEKDYDKLYDQIVPVGELMSSKILSQVLQDNGIDNEWLDARKLVVTDQYFRKANVEWSETEKAIQQAVGKGNVYVTQGFIGGTEGNLMTTLGREGSDYTAAFFAQMLSAEKLTVWKDVPGVLNADPRYFNEPLKLEHISFREAIELSFYGATVIHPKTIKPLQNANIALEVKSFKHPEDTGTIIDEDQKNDADQPIYIYKPNQVLISLSRRDFGFLEEKDLSEVFSILHEEKTEVNLMQNSAINFSIVVDLNPLRLERLIDAFQKSYRVLYNSKLELLTIRHYQGEKHLDLIKNHESLLEQKTRSTLKLLLRNLQE